MPDLAPTLRLARADDARVLAEMSRDHIEGGLGWRYVPSHMRALIRSPDVNVVVACRPDDIAGFAIMQFGDTRAHLVLMCVAPALRRQGVGRHLLDWLLATAEVAGMASIHLELRADNAAALAFYGRLGFHETLLVPGYYEGRVDARRMLRLLRSPTVQQ